MDMGDRPLVSRLGNQYAAIVGIERVAEYVEKKIAFADKADAEAFAVLRF
jgi:hypothetical protein